ncbi:hypothetical protein ACNKHR_21740 [Shigella flexneri]
MSSPRIPAVKSQLRQLDSEACRNWRVRHVNAAVHRKVKRYSPPLRRKKTFAHCWRWRISLLFRILAIKEQAIQFLCGNLGVNGRTEHPF